MTKCGKSFWAFDLAMHIATGRKYRGRLVQQRPVVYIAAEGGGGFAKRVEAFRQRFGAEGAPFYLITGRPSLIHDHVKLKACIQHQLGDVEPGAISIDTLNRTLIGSESSDDDM